MVKSPFPVAETHFRKYSWRNSQTELGGDSATSREITCRGRRVYNHKKKKNPWNFCEELEGYPDSCNSNKLDYSSLMTSFPALFQPCSLQTWSSGAEEEEGSRVIAPPATFCQKVRFTITHWTDAVVQTGGGLWFGVLLKDTFTGQTSLAVPSTKP